MKVIQVTFGFNIDIAAFKSGTRVATVSLCSGKERGIQALFQELTFENGGCTWIPSEYKAYINDRTYDDAENEDFIVCQGKDYQQKKRLSKEEILKAAIIHSSPDPTRILW